ncbi:MAG: hypothetical protein KatS3mg009_2188 [Acidimicrobiia bacterium]|nr:MAG: hypothetical protein KatS3mg009_2188 [Acidimicrobiia bacterium]
MYAPAGSQWQSCAPSAIGIRSLSSVVCTDRSAVNAGHTATSTFS